MSDGDTTSSAYSAPSNLELKPEWPLLSTERTLMSLLTNLPNLTLPPPTTPITEPTYSPADTLLITQLRTDALAHLKQHGLTHPDPSPLNGVHWRDIYNAHRHKTRVVPSPDPRLAAGYQPPAPPTDWPDYLLYQFLVARKRRVDRAVRMLLDWVYWWVTFGMDDLCAQPVCPFAYEVAAFIPERSHGVDKAGRPFVIGHAGGIDLNAYAAVNLPLEAAYVFQSYKRELMRRAAVLASARCGRRVVDFAVVTDLTGFTLAHRLGIPWVRNQAYIDNNFYPETAGQVIVISAPAFFSWIFGLLKSFIDERTQEKISILSSDYSDVVVQRIGRDNTPVEWKGACTLCGGQCLPVVMARDVEGERRRQVEEVKKLEAGEGVVERDVAVAARGVYDEKLTIEAKTSAAADSSVGADVVGYTVWWSIAVQSKDIDFSVSFAPHTGDAWTVKAVERISAGSGSGEDGRVRGCAVVRVGATEGGGGVVTLTFSNSFSMFSSKHVSFKVGVQQESTK